MRETPRTASDQPVHRGVSVSWKWIRPNPEVNAPGTPPSGGSGDLSGELRIVPTTVELRPSDHAELAPRQSPNVSNYGVRPSTFLVTNLPDPDVPVRLIDKAVKRPRPGVPRQTFAVRASQLPIVEVHGPAAGRRRCLAVAGTERLPLTLVGEGY